MLLAFVSAASAAQAVSYELALPEGAAGHIGVEPGQTGSFTFDVRNLEAQAGTAIAFGHLIDVDNAYTFGGGTPVQCGTPYLTQPTATALQWNFPAALGPNASLRCIYPVTRTAMPGSDTKLSLCLRKNDNATVGCDGATKTVIVGILPDIAVAVSPIAEVATGTREVVVSVSVQNHSDVDVGKVALATECKAATGIRPYTLDVDFEGACPRAALNPGCYYNGGLGVPPPIINWLVDVPPAQARGISSCLVKMRFTEPLTAPMLDSLELRRPLQDPFPPIPLLHAANAFGRDVNASNDGPRPFGATPIIVTPVPLGNRTALVCLILLLASLGVRSHRCRRSPR